MKTTSITLSLLCFITFNMHAADEVSNRNHLSEMYDATFNWLLKLSRDRDRDEKILWETSARTRSRIMHMLGHHTPESVAFLDHLHKAEATAQVDVPGKFQLKINPPIGQYFKDSNEFIQNFYEEEPHDELTQTKKFMQDNGIDEYYDYWIALASSTKLTDEEKVKKEFVMLPFFEELCNKREDEKEAIYIDWWRHNNMTKKSHSLDRLFLASLCYAGFNLKNRSLSSVSPFIPLRILEPHPFLSRGSCTFLEDALMKDDIALIEIYLEHGMNPNLSVSPFSPLMLCRSVHAAQLLLKHGANISAQHQRRDLIDFHCRTLGTEYNHRLLPLFLSYVTLDETNTFGNKWIKTLGKLQYIFPSYNIFRQKLSVLLRHGCDYDEAIQQEMINKIDQIPLPKTLSCKDQDTERKKRKQEIEALFKQDQNRRKNVVLGLRNRSLTGKHLVPNTNLRTIYNRVRGLELIKSLNL